MKSKFSTGNWPWFLAAAGILIFFLSQSVKIDLGQTDDPRPTSPNSIDSIRALADRDDLNILFILIDTLRAERLGCYGYDRPTSPFLDRLASEGVRFSRHLAQSSWTKCSMASLWTGLYPTRTGVTRYDDALPEVAQMPAESLAEAGFRTIGLYRNGWVASTFGFEQGFEVYTRPAPVPMNPAIRRENPTISARSTDESVVQAAVEFMRVSRDEKWFLYLHLMDLHEYLYDESTARFGSAYADKYDNSILWTDQTIELLYEYLETWGLAEKTLIVIGSDHGEAFRERGFEGHAREVYRETTEVPWILSFPFKLDPGLVVSSRSQNVDLWPTIFDLIGLDVDPAIDGQSRVPEILANAEGRPYEGEPSVGFAYLDQSWGQRDREAWPAASVVEGDLRFVSTERGQVREAYLFDASEDPEELEDRASSDPETLDRLGEVAEEILSAEPPWGEAPTRDISEMELNQLRALGYSIP